MAGVLVGLGVNGHGGDAHLAGGGDDAAGDFTAVGDQDLGEHGGDLFDLDRPLVIQGEKWVVRDFPQVTVRVGKVAGVTAPENPLPGLEQACTSGDRFGQHVVDLAIAADVVSQRDARKTRRGFNARSAGWHPGILGQVTAAKQREDHTTGTQERHLRTAGQGTLESEPCIERRRPFKIGNTERDDRESWFHHLLLDGAYSGMFPCLRHGFSSFLSLSIARLRQMRLRVSCGWMTSSMKPRAPATKGLAKRALYSASRSASLAGSFFSSRKMISTAPLAPITAISAFGHAKFTSPRRCLEAITS
mmetsp:Transcript_29714/g.55055  ORF Transcript_29714/g.55055 Transcript_29714/m.55055 type:complete len:304 (+) Transcript_29714:2-913(+)